MLVAGRLGAPGVGGKDINRMIGMPTTPKNTENPPQISTEIRAQFLRRMSPVPVAMPKAERQSKKPRKPSVAVLTKGGGSGVAPRALPSKMPNKLKDMRRRVISPVKMAKTAATITEAEADAFGELAI